MNVGPPLVANPQAARSPVTPLTLTHASQFDSPGGRAYTTPVTPDHY
jgi:hypothetical protein